jgi:hypothetical protein
MALMAGITPMAFVIKAEMSDPFAETLAFTAQKTMYDGKQIAAGDMVFLFASENEGERGLVGRGVVTAAVLLPRKPELVRQTPRVDLTIRRTASAVRLLGRTELRQFTTWNDGQPATELNFKLYRQATNKIVGISDEAARYLASFFD